MTTPASPTAVPRATLRLQLHRAFTFDHARALLDDVAALGISHLYVSPITTAQPGSMHGYDVVDPTRVNPELGGEAALGRLVEALHARGMGLIVDIVPNHMSVGGAHNAWWLDVLENGPASAWAHVFDIQWQPPQPALRNKVLAPFLGEPYDAALRGGRLTLHYDPEAAHLAIAYYDHRFPIALADYASILRGAGEPGKHGAEAALDAVADRFASLQSTRAVHARREHADAAREALRHFAATDAGRARIDRAVAAINADPERLHALMARQSWRLAHWRCANDEINWRRFFDIGSLAGLRVERADVFEATHALIFRLYRQGWLDGVRIDHVDGLADPAGYCRQLRQRLAADNAHRPADRRPGRPWIVVEKILAADEPMRTGWGVDGTSGYDFMNQAGALLHAASGEAALTQGWLDWTGRPASEAHFRATALAARRQILHEHFAAELDTAVCALHAVAQQQRETHDVTWHAIRRALAELVVHLPVYRTYADTHGRDAQDTAIMRRAIHDAMPHLRRVDQPVLAQLDAWLGGEPAGHDRLRQLALRRCQQLSSPVAAKAVEDTACYRYGRLLSRNEVGADPGEFALDAAAFHHAMEARARLWPRAMLSTATHDHKRGEDVRARLAVLSERPAHWLAAAQQWRAAHAHWVRPLPDGPAPAPDAQWMLYQTLVGAWPPGLDWRDADGVRAFAERVTQWQRKALREAKLRTDWFAPDIGYEQACHDFVFTLLTGEAAPAFLPSLAAFVRTIAPAGAVNGLAQTLLRVTVPGVPDLYQGADFWDTSLVDPDNRRPVDFAVRHRSLRALQANPGHSLAPLLAHWTDGRIKQAVLARALGVRAAMPEVFASGRYLPLALSGSGGAHALAFAREHAGRWVVAIVPLHAAALLGPAGTPAFPAGAWRDTTVCLPAPLASMPLHSVFDGQTVRGARLALGQALAALPVALLHG
ncbi:malto-oligosyltrehalose synthase [Ralstonia solanacearum]|uniref:malto-oligosyltrehalose synthase n=1 Tax=Ralstonia solanacearum TaxID=305 RepID=UPI00078DE700|nr:malto-oligosyltrehalose synthase [Ralstonia solanacearum]AMP39365.1 malto-oligosyltrehalose synthase [Ralstonia solanacearum]AXV88200.1 malto-oligosyltrehalose synthase [Ralstonia solanacearum]AXW07684.1 malto-oligosyltrehalose synthase [Ralstonia solanacearum]AXW25474.1 malto-oligosyltrehalose synthase [Ralstonia solanacearum]AXW82386.1 malto-oligosyltrehalose synthase [Ralstonia solanacearum]